MNDAEFKKLKKDLEKTNNKLEQLQVLYKSETGRRWLPPLYTSPPICAFCGGKYFHNDNCTLNKIGKALKLNQKKGNWIVKMRCEVYKDVFCENCTKEDAENNPFDYAFDELETEQINWEVESVTPND